MNRADYLPSPNHKSDEEIQELKTRFFNLLVQTDPYDNGRYQKLEILYEDFSEQLLDAPASSRMYFHNSFRGGYLDHVLRVYDIAFELLELFRLQGGLIDFNESELAFAVLHHDLGKLGEPGVPYYIPTNDPKHNNQGVYYIVNPDLPWMTTFDRTMYLLNEYNIKITRNEMMGIKLADGAFSEENRQYFSAKGIFPLDSNIGYLVHWADWMATNVEKSQVRRKFDENMNAYSS